MKEIVIVYPDNTVHDVTVTLAKRCINPITGKQEVLIYYIDHSKEDLGGYASVVEVSGKWYKNDVCLEENQYYYLTDASYIIPQLPSRLTSITSERENFLEERERRQRYIKECLERFECYSPVQFNDVIISLDTIDNGIYETCISEIELLVERFRNVTLITYDRMIQLRNEILCIIDKYSKLTVKRNGSYGLKNIDVLKKYESVSNIDNVCYYYDSLNNRFELGNVNVNDVSSKGFVAIDTSFYDANFDSRYFACFQFVRKDSKKSLMSFCNQDKVLKSKLMWSLRDVAVKNNVIKKYLEFVKGQDKIIDFLYVDENGNKMLCHFSVCDTASKSADILLGDRLKVYIPENNEYLEDERLVFENGISGRYNLEIDKKSYDVHNSEFLKVGKRR